MSDTILHLAEKSLSSLAETEVFKIGWLWPLDEKKWAGQLGNLTTFDRSLSDAEVMALYTVGRPEQPLMEEP
ncbi:MAG: hypothetical protein ACOYZ7_20335 [Chloroflexota bacterium]